jgi:hypothetical protein
MFKEKFAFILGVNRVLKFVAYSHKSHGIF